MVDRAATFGRVQSLPATPRKDVIYLKRTDGAVSGEFDFNVFVSNEDQTHMGCAARRVCLDGPKKLVKGRTSVFEISNFDSRLDYITSTTVGVASVTLYASASGDYNDRGEVSIEIPPETTETHCYLTINGEVSKFEISGDYIYPPVIFYKVGDAVSVNNVFVVDGVYSSDPMFPGGLTASGNVMEIQVSATPDFKVITGTFYSGSFNDTGVNTYPAGVFFLRARYISTIYGNDSDWSFPIRVEFVPVTWPTLEDGIYNVPSSIIPYDGYYDSFFSEDICISPDDAYLAIGSPWTTVDGVYGRGCVLIYKRTSGVWTFFQKLLCPDIYPDDGMGNSLVQFGFRVSLNQDASLLSVCSTSAGWGETTPVVTPDIYIFKRTETEFILSTKLATLIQNDNLYLPNNTQAGEYGGGVYVGSNARFSNGSKLFFFCSDTADSWLCNRLAIFAIDGVNNAIVHLDNYVVPETNSLSTLSVALDAGTIAVAQLNMFFPGNTGEVVGFSLNTNYNGYESFSFPVDPFGTEMFGTSVEISGNGLVVAIADPWYEQNGPAHYARGVVRLYNIDKSDQIFPVATEFASIRAESENTFLGGGFGTLNPSGISMNYHGSYLAVSYGSYSYNNNSNSELMLGKVILYSIDSENKKLLKVNTLTPSPIFSDKGYSSAVELSKHSTLMVVATTHGDENNAPEGRSNFISYS